MPGQAVAGFSPPTAQPLFDVELGKIFLNMRTLLGISLWDMARRVGAEPTVIADLEAGSLSALPPWPELTRLVDAYAAATGIDQQPILARLLRTQAPVNPVFEPRALPPPKTITVQPRIEPAPVPPSEATDGSAGWQGAPIPEAAFQADVRDGPRTRPTTAAQPEVRRRVPVAASAANTVALAPVLEEVTAPSGLQYRIGQILQSALQGARRVLGRKALVLTGAVLVPALFLAAARLYPAALYGVLAPLPAVMAAPLHGGLNQLVAAFAPERDGLTWIDIGDPRLRKADRLPERSR